MKIVCNKTEVTIKRRDGFMFHRKQNVILPAACYYHSYKSKRSLFFIFCVSRCQASAPQTHRRHKTSRPQFLRATKLWTSPRGNRESPRLNHAGFSSFSFGILTSLQPLQHQGPQCVIVWKMGPRGALGLLQEASWFQWITATLLRVHVAQFNLDVF